MAFSRFLLLLIGVISLYLPEAEARPMDFVCKSRNRIRWRKDAEDLTQSVTDCLGPHVTLSTPIQLPAVGLHPSEWENQTLLQKYAEVVGVLKVFEVELQEAANQIKSNCHTFLATITHRITNYVLILERQIQNDTAAVSPHVDVSSSLTDILKAYQQLLKGKLEHFFEELCDLRLRTTTRNG